MAGLTWGMLDKSQVDPEKIEEAIARLIAAHNEDEEAHLGSGQSLQSHKASEIIDHVVDSIVTDKIKDKEITVEKTTLLDKLVLEPTFATLDGWYQLTEGTGAKITSRVGYVELKAGLVVDNKTILAANLWDVIYRATTDKNPFLRCVVKPLEKDFCDFIFGYGDSTPFSPSGLVAFYWSDADSKLYAYTKAPGFAEQKVEIAGINVNGLHEYAIEILSQGSSIKFYVDGVLKTTVSRSGFSIDSDVGPVFAVSNKEAGENPAVWFGSFYLYQDK